MFGFARSRETRQSTRPGEEHPDSGVRTTKSSTCDECGSTEWVRIVREHRAPFRRPVTLVAVQCADCGRTPF